MDVFSHPCLNHPMMKNIDPAPRRGTHVHTLLLLRCYIITPLYYLNQFSFLEYSLCNIGKKKD